jgi:hypothetical protein
LTLHLARIHPYQSCRARAVTPEDVPRVRFSLTRRPAIQPEYRAEFVRLIIPALLFPAFRHGALAEVIAAKVPISFACVAIFTTSKPKTHHNRARHNGRRQRECSVLAHHLHLAQCRLTMQGAKSQAKRERNAKDAAKGPTSQLKANAVCRPDTATTPAVAGSASTIVPFRISER